jgi:hypothetical protein
MFTTNSYLRHDQLSTSIGDLVALLPHIICVHSIVCYTSCYRPCWKCRYTARVSFHLIVHATPSIKQKPKLLKQRGWKQVIRLACGRCRLIQYRHGAVQAKQPTCLLAHFTTVLSFRYVKFNFCYSFVHIVTINFSNVNMSCETVKKRIFKSTTPAKMFMSFWEVRVINSGEVRQS